MPQSCPTRPKVAVLLIAGLILLGCSPASVIPPKPAPGTGTDPGTGTVPDTGPVLSTKECQPSRSRTCYFRNSPVALIGDPILLPGRPYPFRRTAQQLDFVDADGAEWAAPADTLTDGASIPPFLVPIVGDPTLPEFANAAAVHDAYCGVGNEMGENYQKAPWQAVHRMFYDTLIVGGTSVPKAQLMFSAVWLGGPRWAEAGARNDRSLAAVSRSVQTKAVLETKAFIDKESPDLDELLRYLEWQEDAMRWEAAP